MVVKLGYNLMESAETNKPAMNAHIQHTQSPVLVINSEPRALELTEVSPLVMSRFTHIDDHRRDEGIFPIYQFPPIEYVKILLRKSPSKRTVKIILNEPNTGNVKELMRLCNWLSEVGALLAQRGYRAVLGNFTVGSEKWEHINVGAYDKLIRTIHEYREYLSYGAHSYTYGALPLGWGVWTWQNIDPRTAPDNPIENPQNWFNRGAIRPKNMWHLGRHLWVTNLRAEQILGTGMSIPCDITEIGWAKVDDIADQDPTFYAYMDSLYPASEGVHGLNGAESLAHLWKTWWGGWSHAQAMYYQLEHTLSLYPDNVRSAMYFSLGTFGEFGMDSINNHEFFRLREHMIKQIAENPVIIDEKPDTIPLRQYPIYRANDARWYTVSLRARSRQKANVRQFPTITSAVISEIPNREPRAVYWLDEPYVDRDNNRWMPTKIVMERHPDSVDDVEIVGWVRMDVVNVITPSTK